MSEFERLAEIVNMLLDGMYAPGETVTHSPDCTDPRCVTYAVLQAYGVLDANGVEHEMVIDVIDVFVQRWLARRPAGGNGHSP